jgi:hypothetical protein
MLSSLPRQQDEEVEAHTSLNCFFCHPRLALIANGAVNKI